MKTSLKKYEKFLKDHQVKEKDGVHNFTRMPDKNLKIYGGKYYIPDDKKEQFYQLYIDYVFTNQKYEYLTECQLPTGEGPILVDVDLRYDTSVTKRQHKHDDIISIIQCHLDSLKEILVFDETTFPIYIFEKPNVVVQDDKTKDGIHMVFGIKLDYPYQMELRKKVVDNIANYDLEIPITNTWDNVFDVAISRGKTNWTLYGSRKPAFDAYSLVAAYNLTYDSRDGEFSMEEIALGTLTINDYFRKISAQYKENVSFDVNTKIIDQVENNISSRPKKKNTLKVRTLDEMEDLNPDNIKNIEDLNTCLDKLFDSTANIHSSEYNLKEVYNIVMILPEEYYMEFDKWIRVGWALKNIDNRLFYVWIKFSSQWKDFDYGDIGTRFDEWNNFDCGEGCLGYGSIMYWARTHWDEYCKNNPNEENKYEEVYKDTLDYYLEESIRECNDYNLAMVLYKLLVSRLSCASIKNKLWFEFNGNNWNEIDSGHTLGNVMSTEMYNLYCDKILPLLQEIKDIQNDDDKWAPLSEKIAKIQKICNQIKNNGPKERIKREAESIFYDADFYERLDSNPLLLGVKNGIIDFKEKVFRPGSAKDYVSKNTHVNYTHPDKWDPKIMKEIDAFMSQLFPDESLRSYIWDTLASTLNGENKNQTFNNFYGSGSNGKTKIIELMKSVLGDYYGVVPTSYMVSKREGVGQTSSGIAQLKGARFAIINEPTTGDKLNDGKLKEITGGDDLTARELFQKQMTFKPQFKIIVCTNNLFEINDRSDGMWRRIRIVIFESKFKRKENFEPNRKFQFEIDENLDAKLETWKSVFLSRLIHRVFETEGIVHDCSRVKEASEDYRKSQDHLMCFMTTSIEQRDDSEITITRLRDEYDLFCIENNITKKHKKSDLENEMTKYYGKRHARKGWLNVGFVEKEYDE
jgi:P4 family phage/plasmid primase-like protien